MVRWENNVGICFIFLCFPPHYYSVSKACSFTLFQSHKTMAQGLSSVKNINAKCLGKCISYSQSIPGKLKDVEENNSWRSYLHSTKWFISFFGVRRTRRRWESMFICLGVCTVHAGNPEEPLPSLICCLLHFTTAISCFQDRLTNYTTVLVQCDFVPPSDEGRNLFLS